METSNMIAPLSATEADTATGEACNCETAQWMRYPGVFLLGAGGCLLGLFAGIWSEVVHRQLVSATLGAFILGCWLTANPARASRHRSKQGRTYTRLLAHLFILAAAVGLVLQVVSDVQTNRDERRARHAEAEIK